MLKVIQHFLDHLAQRLVVIVAQLVSSAVETLHASEQAEQQSRLEDLARQYEADDKPHVAAALRRRADALTSADPAQEALPILGNLTEEEADGGSTPRLQSSGIDGLPELGTTKRRTKTARRKRSSTTKENHED